ncbi:aldehyde dehydrogenase family protein [Paraburkholderia susongensis]|uniref:aldehyde dehydrogenase (NAD(+)) n=1 Tax=Paraburkholderia susongensis TaxID=1515439 RepID=A0A1X7LJF7_9BURK|nr:aldehyde dehydrogenase family protein [Paraburkholderia susongensis]SMG54028.1 aldehyde dehydrogenase (NAD+) [Paraburkholderia susongensis]
MIDTDRFYIDGQWVAPRGKDTFAIVDPATEKVTGQLAMGNAQDADAAVAAAHRAFDAWSATTRETRLGLLTRLLELYNAGADEMSKLMTAEMGVASGFSRSAQIALGRAHLETAIRVLREFSFTEQRGATLLAKEPIGVCALITPWNWPMNQLVVKVAPALAAGCTMVVKPSEFSPYSALLFARMIHDAGFPAGVFNLVNGDGSVVGEALSRDPRVDMVSITGSTRAGIAVATAAAQSVKRVHQELGGKSANIIFEDADFERAVAFGVRASYLNCGQSCSAPTRMLVPRAMMERAARIAADTANGIRVGAPENGDTDLGPVVNAKQYAHIQSLIESGIEQGATLAAGGPGRPEGISKGYFVRPTVFADVSPDMRIAREEIFGPVLSIIPFDDEAQAIAIANDSPYGLAGYVQTKDQERARRVAAKMRVGNVYINEAPWDSNAPFGGYKQSGNGREHAEFGLGDYLEIKAIAGYGG